MDNLGPVLFKLLLVALTAPLWFPFLRAVWEEFNLGMAEEGGIFGMPPGPQRLREIEQERRQRPDPLVHEPWMTPERRRASRREMRGSEPSHSATRPKRRGF